MFDLPPQCHLWLWRGRWRVRQPGSSFITEGFNGLVLASALSFAATTNVAAEYDSKVYATDASLSKGAVVSSSQPSKVCEALWLGGDKKGCDTKLDNPFRAALSSHGLSEMIDEDEDHESPPSLPKKGLDFSFDFVVRDLSESGANNLEDVRLLSG